MTEIDTDKYMLIKDHATSLNEIIIEMRDKESFYAQEANDIMESMDHLSKEGVKIREENNKFYKLHCQQQDIINGYKNIGFPVIFILGWIVGYIT